MQIISMNHASSNEFWKNYNFRIEPWGTDFASPIDLEEDTSYSPIMNLAAESALWTKLRPSYQPTLPPKIVFIDGRRRLDIRFVGRENNRALYGAFATIAVGGVLIECAIHKATCLPFTIHRVIAIGDNQIAPITDIPCPLGSKNQLLYNESLTDLDNDPKIPIMLVQKRMLQEEAEFARNVIRDPKTLVIKDGSSQHFGLYQLPVPTLGYVKTMGKAYLTGEYAELLWQLELGERTPIFTMGEKRGTQQFWSWYLRTGHPLVCHKRLGYHDWHGIVRLDLSAEVPLEKARELADLTTYLIPYFSSHPSRDSRSPQNLTPVGALEKELGRQMGDKLVIERRLRHFLASFRR